MNQILVHLKKFFEVFNLYHIPYKDKIYIFSFVLDNEIDGPTLLKLSESMVVRLFPTIKLEVQFLDLLQLLKKRHIAELNSKKTLASSSSLTNGRPTINHPAAHVIASSSLDNGNGHLSNSNSPPTAINGHQQIKTTFSERSQISKGPSLPLKTFKREPKYFLNQYEKKKIFFFSQKFFSLHLVLNPMVI
jgi:hypothetical protein